MESAARRLKADNSGYRQRRVTIDIDSIPIRTADLSSLGPDRSKATWEAISLLVCVAIATALPIDRMRKLFGAVNASSGASIYR